jgi:hypothetical protein
MTIAEGGGKRAVTKKFQEVYVPALKANYLVWPAVQMLNFRIIPLQFQIVRFSFRLFAFCLLILVAFRIYNRYCVDSLPLPYQLIG